jgi:hypothetical protein
MYRNPNRPKSVLIHLIGTILLALGLALFDLPVVRSQGSLAAPSPPIPAIAASAGGAVAPASGRTIVARCTASSGRLVLSRCAAGRCQPVASPSLTGRPGALRTRFSSQGKQGVKRLSTGPARIAPLSTAPPVPAFTTDCRFVLDLPWRPARQSGADLSIPRPPPLRAA